MYFIAFLLYFSDDDNIDLHKGGQLDGKGGVVGGLLGPGNQQMHLGGQQNPFLGLPDTNSAIEYKKGYVMRKCCYDANYKKSKSLIFYSTP